VCVKYLLYEVKRVGYSSIQNSVHREFEVLKGVREDMQFCWGMISIHQVAKLNIPGDLNLQGS
jgi:hypothetical protein